MALQSEEKSKKKSVMVIGGGIAGMTAAQILTGHGIRVHLIEKNDHLGGHASWWACMATDTCQYCSSCLSFETADKIFPNKNPATHLNTKIIKINKNSKTFTVQLQNKTNHTIEVEKIVVATGFKPTRPTGLLGQAYGSSEQIITTVELNQNLKNNTLKKYFPETDTPEIGFIQCVGSRNREKGKDYCSQVCCKVSLRHIKKLLHLYPGAKISLFYIDLQIIGKETRSEFDSLSDQIDLIQGVPFEIFTNKNGRLSVIKEDDKSPGRVAAHFDMMVLSVGIQAPDSSSSISDMLGISLNKWGFIDKPESLIKKNIYVAGCVAGPVDILTAKQQGIICAGQIIKSFSLQQKDFSKTLHPVAVIGDGEDAYKTAFFISGKGYEVKMFGLGPKKNIKIPGIQYIPCSNLISINGTAGNFSMIYTDFGKIKQGLFAAVIVAEGIKTTPIENIHLSDKVLYSLSRFLNCVQDSPETIPRTLSFWLDYSQPEYKTFSKAALKAGIQLAEKGRQIIFIMNKMLVHGLGGQRIYDTARKKGIRFLRVNSPDDVSIKQGNGKILFDLKEKTLSNVLISFESNWLIIPETVHPGDKNPMVATLLKDHLDREGYLQPANIRYQPSLSARTGIYYTGSCHGETDDQDQNMELELILNSLYRIADTGEASSPADIEINKKKCRKCLTCLRICPHGAIVLDNGINPCIDPMACFSCGLCLAGCPALAIESKIFSDTLYVDQISKGDIVIFACERSGALAAKGCVHDFSVNIQKVPCVCRISKNILLKTLEKGVKKIILAGCHQDNCRSIKGAQKAKIHAEFLTGLPGFDHSCISFFPVAANESSKFKTFLSSVYLENQDNKGQYNEKNNTQTKHLSYK